MALSTDRGRGSQGPDGGRPNTSMDETKEQPTELHELPEGDLDLDLADLDLDIPDLAEVDPTLPVVDDSAPAGSDIMADMSDLDTAEIGDDLSFQDGGAGSDLSMDWDLPPEASDLSLAPDDSDADQPIAGGVDSLAPDDEDDLQPVALSESELETILGSGSDDPIGGPIADFDETLEAPSLSGDFEELATTDDSDLEITDADLTIDDSAGRADAADDVEHEELTPVADGDLDFDLPEDMIVAGFPDDEDSEPVTLSEDELGSILDDVDPNETLAEGIAPPDPALAMGHHAPVSSSLEEDISLSDDELNQVLLDGDLGGPSVSPAAPSLLDDEDEEPITLTAEELGNIVADVETVGADGPSGLASPPAGSSIFDSDEDEGPVALSETELEAILEDVDEGPGGALAELGGPGDLYDGAMEPSEGDEHVIVLDDYEDEVADSGAGTAAAAAAAGAGAGALAGREGSPVIDRAADQSGLDKGDLKKMISYLDGLFEQLPDSTVEEFSRSEYYDLYKKIMSELGIGQ